MSDLSWDEAVVAMKSEGYEFTVTITTRNVGGEISTDAEPGAMEKALGRHLQRCLERWPKRHVWDEFDVERLLVICHNLGWRTPTGTSARKGVIIERDPDVMGDRKWCVCLMPPPGSARPSECYAATPRLALLGAMKEREKR